MKLWEEASHKMSAKIASSHLREAFLESMGAFHETHSKNFKFNVQLYYHIYSI